VKYRQQVGKFANSAYSVSISRLQQLAMQQRHIHPESILEIKGPY